MPSPPPPRDEPFGLRGVLSVVLVCKAAALVLLLTVFWRSERTSHLVQDIRTWREFFLQAQAGLVPYVHFTKEYPILGGLVYWAMSPFVEPDNLRQTIVVHALFMAAADLACTAIFFRLARAASSRYAVPATLLFSLNLTSLVFFSVRFESWVVLFALAGLLAHWHRRFRLATLLWALGCGLKWYPAFFVAAQEWRLLMVEKRRWHWVGALLVFAAVTAAMNVPFLLGTLRATGNLDYWTYPYRFHAQRPLYWDTVIGVGQIWLGSWPLERYAGLWSLALMGLAILVRPRMDVETKGVLVCLAAVVFNRIYSTQFNLWFYPLLILTALRRPPRERHALLAFFVVLDLLNVLVFPFAFAPAVAEMGGLFPDAAREHGGSWAVVFSAAILARALVVVALGAYLLSRPDPAGLDSADPENA